MNIRPSAQDFAVGDTVKLTRLPRHDWRHSRDILGRIGEVVAIFDDDEEHQWVDVKFGPRGSECVVRPWWLERGRMEWITS